MSLAFNYLLLRSICGIGNFVTADITAVFVNNNMILSDEDKILIKSLYLKGYTAKRSTYEFPENSWSMHGVNKLFKKVQDTAQFTGGQAVVDRALLALKKTLSFFFRSSHSLPLTLFCRLSGEVTKNTFLFVKKTKSVAYCRNF